MPGFDEVVGSIASKYNLPHLSTQSPTDPARRQNPFSGKRMAAETFLTKRFILKWLVTQKSLQDFFLVFNMYAQISGYLDLKFINLSLFGGFLGVFIQKGSNWSILNLNNRRIGCLKVHFINQKKCCTEGGKPTKKIFFWVTSHFKGFCKKWWVSYLYKNNMNATKKYSWNHYSLVGFTFMHDDQLFFCV